ncbi:MAG: ImmA/IrrE family metallo-endopeptidase [Ignavibacteriae bacterium]|nr:ImmA/IrrE family metallo-endopeptidase [Ignavibacteriota bacterium]
MDLEELSTFKAPYYTNNQIYEKADSFRAKYWRDKGLPVDIEKIIEFELGITIIPRENLCHIYEGMETSISKDMTEITIDKAISENPASEKRLRFSLAHEVGHFVLHKDIYSKFSFNSIEEWIMLINNIPEFQYGMIEKHAYEFAGRLLVPRDELIKEIQVKKDKIKMYLSIIPQFNSEEKTDYLKNYLSGTINDVFGVSASVIERRIDREKIDLYNIK